jgi:hypothetical protein
VADNRSLQGCLQPMPLPTKRGSRRPTQEMLLAIVFRVS